MDEKLLRELATDHLLPFFSGAELLDSSRKSNKSQSKVAREDPSTMLFKIDRNDLYRLVLRRSQYFDSDNSGRVTEKKVVEAFVETVDEIAPGLNQNYREDLLASFHRRIVSKSLVDQLYQQQAILNGVDQLALWATRLYEGKQIAAAIGFEPNTTGGGVALSEICQKDFSAVLSNGFDTMYIFDFQQRIIGHQSFHQSDPLPSFAPLRQGFIANWASEGRVALALNRLGEILVFKDRMLLFARRSGKWHFLTHEPVLTQMRRPDGSEVRRAVYESCLDASFARTGACVGVITSAYQLTWKNVAPEVEDYLADCKSVKTKTISKMVQGKPFQDLDRRLRQEMLAIDGATILDHKGKVLAVGAILKISGGSVGGGRRAAAVALSRFGLGIKVSQDGEILIFHDGNEEPKVSLMKSNK